MKLCSACGKPWKDHSPWLKKAHEEMIAASKKLKLERKVWRRIRY